MANGNFVVQNGLTIGPLTIDAATGSITTTGSVTTGSPTNVIAQGSSNLTVLTSTIYGNISGTPVLTATSSGLTVTGDLTVTGKEIITQTEIVSQVLYAGGNLVANSGTASTSVTTGALVVAGSGGVGIGGALYAGSVYDNGTRVVSTSTSAGNLTISAGAINLTATGPGAATVGSSTAIPVITTDAYGRVSATSTAAVIAPAGTLSGSTLASGVTASSLTSVGTLTGLTVSGTIQPNANASVNLGSTSAWWATIYGVATQAKYADLAENYQADKTYAPGTVVMFGGSAEVTIAEADTTAVAGVVSTNPAHLMNGMLQGPGVIALALQGRVPCNIIGPVTKGDMLVSAGYGYAKASANPQVGQVIGKALQDFPAAGKAVIEVVVGRF
jgi:hypothetical protein